MRVEGRIIRLGGTSKWFWQSEELMSVEDTVRSLADEIKKMRDTLGEFMERHVVKDFYSTEEFAKLKRLEPKTVRDNLNAGRLNGVKRRDGHGRSQRWAIPHG